VYSERLIKEWGLEKHLNKVSIAQEHFLDVDKFRIQKNLDKRDDLCGYIGALEKWKGVLNFIEASLKVLVRREDVRFLIGGEGRLKSGIEELVNIKGLNDKIRIVGLIPHDEVPKYLNELKLLVLPSHTEGLPNIILEAMACGTPVLATPVGAIPDVIKDEETGFIMEDNTPDCIAKNIIRALNHPNLDEIVKRARNLIEEQFTYEAAVERYKKILEVLD
jgi:glycosyltransferase involved in cell wall biosynthesis